MSKWTISQYTKLDDLKHWLVWFWPIRTSIYWFNRIKYFIKHGKDEYGELGFSQLFYKGLPIIQRDDMPPNLVGFLNEKTGKMQILNIKTGKKQTLKFRPFVFKGFKV